MTKKDVSRRNFLKGIAQAAGAATLAKVFKFFPEAKGVFASNVSNKARVWPLPSSDAERLITQALNDTNSNILREYLDKQGFVEVPGIYFAQRSRIVTEDEEGRTHRHQTDVLVVGYSSTPQENRGAMFLLVVDSGSATSQWQVPLIAIQDDALYYVQDGQVAVHKDRDNPLITASWFSDFVQGVSPMQDAAPLNNHGPCANQINQCLILSSSCGAFAVCCGLGVLPCCVGAVGACAASSTACFIAAGCCNSNPGSHGC
jgi:hypothetical protein